jgi:hypothetical protein
MLKDIKVEYNQPISILCDNTSAINISKNHVMHLKTKHIPIKYHFLREKVTEQNVKLEYIGTKEQIVDIFTKPLPRETFEYLRQETGSGTYAIQSLKHFKRSTSSGGVAERKKVVGCRYGENKE